MKKERVAGKASTRMRATKPRQRIGSMPSHRVPLRKDRREEPRARKAGERPLKPVIRPTTPVRKVPCYFFHAPDGGGCQFGDKCRHDHTPISEIVKKELKRPVSRSEIQVETKDQRQIDDQASKAAEAYHTAILLRKKAPVKTATVANLNTSLSSKLRRGPQPFLQRKPHLKQPHAL